MSKVLFWRAGVVIEGEAPTVQEAAKLGCVGRPCVVLEEPLPLWRYGTLDFRKHSRKHMPFDDFPKAFRLALLLMEVR